MSRLKIALIAGLSAVSSMAADIPRGLPSSDNLFLVARELYGRKLIDSFEYSELSPDTLSADNDSGRKLIEQYSQLFAGYSRNFEKPTIIFGSELVATAGNGKPESAYLKFFPKASVLFSPYITADIIYRLDGELPDDPRYDGKSWRGWAGLAENATISYRRGRAKFKFGFERFSWGMGRYGNLMFSKQALPMTALEFGYKTSKFEFESMAGFLSPLSEELDLHPYDSTWISPQQRYISAHSLTIRPIDALSISLREAVIYGGPGRRFEPAYAFPLIWYHGYQLNSRMDDNTLVSMGIDYRHKGKFWLYSDLLIDDFQIEKKSKSDNEPNQFGFIGGLEVYDLPVGGLTYRLEYARVNNWVYNQPRPYNRYINRNFPIGFPDGPDNDIVNWAVSYWLPHSVNVAYHGYYQRVGEGRINAAWTAPWLYVDDYSEPFPAGVVKKSFINGLTFLILYKSDFWGKMGIQSADIINADNIDGKYENNWEFSIEFGYNTPPFGWGF